MFFDAEHFFDGYKRNPEFSLSSALRLRPWPGPRQSCFATPTVARCLPKWRAGREPTVVGHIDCRRRYPSPQRQRGCGIANALAAVRAGATQVQGTINGYGETGRELATSSPIMGQPRTQDGHSRAFPEGRLEHLTSVAHPCGRAREFLCPILSSPMWAPQHSLTRPASTHRG